MGKTYDKKFKQEVTEYAFNHSALVARKLYGVPKTTLNAWLKKYKQSLLNRDNAKTENSFAMDYISLIDQKIDELQKLKEQIKQLDTQLKGINI